MDIYVVAFATVRQVSDISDIFFLAFSWEDLTIMLC